MQPVSLQQYRPLTFDTLSQRLRSQQPLLVSNDQASMCLAGAQEKMGLRRDAKRGTLSESVGLSPTTHILKSDTRLDGYRAQTLQPARRVVAQSPTDAPMPQRTL